MEGRRALHGAWAWVVTACQDRHCQRSRFDRHDWRAGEGGACEDVDIAAAELDAVHERIAGRFARSEPRARVREYLAGLVAGLERKNGWTLAERAGEVSPDGMQRLLRHADWDTREVRDDVRAYVVEQLGDAGGVLIADLCRSRNYAEARAA